MKLKIVFAVLVTMLLGLLSCEKPSEFTDRESYQVDTLYIYQKDTVCMSNVDTVYVSNVDTLYVACDCEGGAPTLPPASNTLTLTIDCAAGQPFTEDISTTDTEEAKTWYLSQDGVEYPFHISGTKGYKFANNSIRLNEGGAGATAILLPAIQEMKLVSVYVNVTNSASDSGKEIMISAEQSNKIYIDTFAFAKTDADVKEHTFSLTATEAGKSYYVVAKQGKTQIGKLAVIYEK